MRRRRSQVERVLRFEFPDSDAPPPPLPLHADAEARAKADLHREWWKRQRAARDERRKELLKMPDKDLDALATLRWEQHDADDRRRRDKQTPRVYEPMWESWIHEDEWELPDAALLLMSLDPCKGLGLHLKQMLSGEYATRKGYSVDDLSDEAASLFDRTHEMLRRALVAHKKGKLALGVAAGIVGKEPALAVDPSKFLTWAISKGYQLPPPLQVCMPEGYEKAAIPVERKSSKGTVRRQDILSAVITKAVNDAEESSTAAVWIRLCEMARQGQAPLRGLVRGRDALLYTKPDNKIAEFTKNALDKRLARRK